MTNRRRLLLLLFFFSGAAALIYEISWVRKLELIFGTTAYAVATVLAVFFNGLALGSLIFGVLADRTASKKGMRQLLVLFASLELGVAAYAILTPTFFKLISSAQVSLAQSLGYGFTGFNLATLLLSFAVLLIPSTLIGGTLPVLVRYFGAPQIGRKTGILYGVNTAGAVLGTILSGFVLVFFLGINGAIFTAAAVNLAVALTVLLLIVPKEKRTAGKAPEPTPAGQDRKLARLILAAFFFTGFAALALEVLWTRVLILAIGTSLYSFSIILAAFILGLALGSLIISRFVERINALNWLIGILFFLGFSVVFTTFVLGSLPLTFFSLVKAFDVGSFLGAQAIGVLVSFLILLIPTLLMGASFPLGVKIYVQDERDVGLRIGRIYSLNTIGGVAGSLVGGFLFLPTLGLQKSIVVAAAIYLLVATVFLFALSKRTGLAVGSAIFSTLFILIAFFITPWQKHILNSGLYLILGFPAEASKETIRSLLLTDDLLYYKEGVSATISVFEGGNQRFLKINGKTDAGTASDDLRTQLLSGHIPMMLHEEPNSVLVIGLGSGVTLGAVEAYPAETIDAVEIEPAVVEAAGYFADFNNDALADPRLRMMVDDARNFLKVTEAKYDVITSEPSNFWIQGNYNLFTQEFYQLARKRLNKGGIFMQWLHTYQVDTGSLKTAIATLRSVFPYVSAWSPVALYGDILLVASEEPLQFEVKDIRDKFSDEKIKSDLARAQIQTVDDFMALLFLDYSAVEGFSQAAPFHTDDWPILGMKAPFSLYHIYATSENVAELTRFRNETLYEMFVFENQEQKERFRELNRARDLFAQGLLLDAGEKFEEATVFYEKALELYPGQEQIKLTLRSNYLFLVDKYRRVRDLERAKYYLEKLKELKNK